MLCCVCKSSALLSFSNNSLTNVSCSLLGLVLNAQRFGSLAIHQDMSIIFQSLQVSFGHDPYISPCFNMWLVDPTSYQPHSAHRPWASHVANISDWPSAVLSFCLGVFDSWTQRKCPEVSWLNWVKLAWEDQLFQWKAEDICWKWRLTIWASGSTPTHCITWWENPC